MKDNKSEGSALGREYGVERIRDEDKSFKLLDYIWMGFGWGINTGSWYFGGVFATLGFVGAMFMGWFVSPLMMVPWAFLGIIAYKHSITTSGMTRACFGVRGSILPSLFQTVAMAGWAAMNTYIAAISLSFIFEITLGWAPYGAEGSTKGMIVGICIVGITQGILAVAGHVIIKYMEWVTGIALIALGIWETIVIIQTFDLSDILSWKAAVPIMSIGVMIDTMFGFNWSWTQVGDFSRFAKTKRASSLGPWIGLNLGQGWFFFIGAVGVVAVAIQTGEFNPDMSDPSSVMAELGLGWVAFLVVVLASINTNATNVYSSSMGILNITKKLSPKAALIIIAIIQLALCFIPLMYESFYTFFTDFLNITAGLFVPFWTIVLIDYFSVRRGKLDDDLFEGKSGKYWYKNGFNKYGVIALLVGVIVYYVMFFFMPNIQDIVSCSIPTAIIVAIVYHILGTKGVKEGYIKL